MHPFQRTPALHLRTRRASALRAACLATLLAAPTAAQSQAIPCPAARAFPPATPPPTEDGDFEFAGLASNAVQAGPFMWGDWNFTLFDVGIAGEDSAIASSAGPAPSGHCVAYMRDLAAIAVIVDIPPGISRLRYDAAGVPGTTGELGGLLTYWQVGGVSGLIDNLPAVEPAYETRYSPTFYNPTGTPIPSFFFFVNVAVGGSTCLLDDIVIQEIPDWNAAATWGATPPPTGSSDVTIPEGSCVGIHGTLDAKTITVVGELLATTADCTLSTELLHVTQATPTGAAGLFEVGRPEMPYTRQFRLELEGDYADPTVATGSVTVGPPGDMSTCKATLLSDPLHKAMVASLGGRIEMHGLPKVSWTKLAADASVNDLSIVVDDATGWKANDEIVLVGSKMSIIPRTNKNLQTGEPTPVQSEMAVVATTSFDAGTGLYTITLNAPLTNDFNGQHDNPTDNLQRTFAQGQVTLDLDLRTEVGVLTHNVKIDGKPVDFAGLPDPVSVLSTTSLIDRQPHDVGAGFAGHVMIKGSDDAAEASGQGYFSYVEFADLGQSRHLGRYPLHWHMNRDQGAGQYAESCSIHHGFNRAITVHGTDGVRLSRNVVYETLGHSIFLEDGSEQGNLIEENLVVATRQPSTEDAVLMTDHQPSDFQSRSPASFWISNPNNTFVGNVAADNTLGVGYWLIFSPAVHGLSSGQVPGVDGHHPFVKPDELSIGAFSANVAHGCATGLDVNDAVQPLTSIANGVCAGENSKNNAWTPLLPGGLPDPDGALLEDTTIYCCDTAIYTGSAEKKAPGFVEFLRLRLADNRVGLRFASFDRTVNAWILADSGNGLFDEAEALVGMIPTEDPFILEAYRIYDGAASLLDSLVEGFHAPGTHFIGHNNAAGRHTNHTFRGVEFLPDPAAGASNYPVLEWLNYFGPGAGAGATSGQVPFENPNSWGFNVLDDDGTLSSAFGNPAGGPFKSIISNHEMMTTAVDVPVPANGVPTTNAFLSPHIFTHYQFVFGDESQLPVQYTRKVPGEIPSQYKTLSDQHKNGSPQYVQLALIADAGVVYEVGLNTPLATGDTFTAVFSDVPAGTVVQLEYLLTAGSPPMVEETINGVLTPLFPVPLSQLPSETSTAWSWDSATGVMTLRVVQAGVKDEIVVTR